MWKACQKLSNSSCTYGQGRKEEIYRNIAEKGKKTSEQGWSKKSQSGLVYEERLNGLGPKNKPRERHSKW